MVLVPTAWCLYYTGVIAFTGELFHEYNDSPLLSWHISRIHDLQLPRVFHNSQCKALQRHVSHGTDYLPVRTMVLTSKGFGISHCQPSRIMTIPPLLLQAQVYTLRRLSKHPSLPNRCSSPKADTRGLGLPSDIPVCILTHAFRLWLPIMSARKATSCP